MKVRSTLGPEEGDQGEMVILNRRVSWMEGGLEIKAAPRHTEEIVQGMGVSTGSKGLDA